jgi:hypothetical protein
MAGKVFRQRWEGADQGGAERSGVEARCGLRDNDRGYAVGSGRGEGRCDAASKGRREERRGRLYKGGAPACS